MNSVSFGFYRDESRYTLAWLVTVAQQGVMVNPVDVEIMELADLTDAIN